MKTISAFTPIQAARVLAFFERVRTEASDLLDDIDPKRLYPSRLNDDTCVMAKLHGIMMIAAQARHYPALKNKATKS